MRGLGLDLSDADIAGVFNELDADGSGVMELKEFLNKIKVRVRVRVRVGLGLGLGLGLGSLTLTLTLTLTLP